MAREFNSFENVLKMSIKYQIGYMERYLIELLSDIDDEKIAKVRVDFEESGAESQAVTRQTAEFFFKAFKWHGCRTHKSPDTITILPAEPFVRYSVSFFIDNPSISAVNSIIKTLSDIHSRPPLIRDTALHSAVSQRVTSPVDIIKNPATIIELPGKTDL